MKEITIKTCEGCKWSYVADGCIRKSDPNIHYDTKGYLIGCENGWEAKPVSLVDKIYHCMNLPSATNCAFTYTETIQHTIKYISEHIEEMFDVEKITDNWELGCSNVELIKQSIKKDIT